MDSGLTASHLRFRHVSLQDKAETFSLRFLFVMTICMFVECVDLRNLQLRIEKYLFSMPNVEAIKQSKRNE